MAKSVNIFDVVVYIWGSKKHYFSVKKKITVKEKKGKFYSCAYCMTASENRLRFYLYLSCSNNWGSVLWDTGLACTHPLCMSNSRNWQCTLGFPQTFQKCLMTEKVTVVLIGSWGKKEKQNCWLLNYLSTCCYSAKHHRKLPPVFLLSRIL